MFSPHFDVICDLLLINPTASHPSLLPHPLPSHIKLCGDGGRAKQQVEATTGSCSLDPARRRPRTLVVHLCIRGSRGVPQHPWRLSSPIKDCTAHPSKGGA